MYISHAFDSIAHKYVFINTRKYLSICQYYTQIHLLPHTVRIPRDRDEYIHTSLHTYCQLHYRITRSSRGFQIYLGMHPCNLIKFVFSKWITNYNIYFENFTVNNEYLINTSYIISGYHWSSITFFIYRHGFFQIDYVVI